jgi:hypothetical protein
MRDVVRVDQRIDEITRETIVATATGRGAQIGPV